MDPEMIRLAQEQMSRIQQMFSNPELLRAVSEGCRQSFQAANSAFARPQNEDVPVSWTSRMANVTPEQLASMNSFSSAQENYEYKGALMLKNQGNELHGNGNFREAIEKYQKAKQNILSITTPDASKLRLACSSNLMSCYLKTAQYQEAIKEGTEVLASDSKNLKALYRRGQAYKELGQFEKAVADLSQAAKIAPDDETVADVLRQAKKDLEDSPVANPEQTETEVDPLPSAHRDGPIIEEITEEEAERLTSNSRPDPQEATSTNPPGIPDQTYAEALRAMQNNPDLLRNMHSMVSNMDPEQIAGLSGMTPEMARMGADMMKNLSPSDLERMVQVAGSMQQPPASETRVSSSMSAPDVAGNLRRGPATSSTNAGPATSSENASTSSPFAGLGMPQAQMDPQQMAALSGGRVTPEMAKLGADMMKNMSPSDMERMAEMARSMQAGRSDSSSPFSGTGLQATMKDPAMQKMMVSMMKSMTPEAMASMSEQMGMNLSPDQAVELQKSLSQLSPDQLDTMMRWAERSQRVAEQAKRAKAWILGKQGLIFAILVLLVAVILHYLGFIGRRTGGRYIHKPGDCNK